MMVSRSRISRGLTLLELLLSLSITAMVAAAVASMLGAVTSGVSARRDSRSAMVLASAAAARFSAYVAPSRCILDSASDGITLWLNDSRQSDSVHASEIRWIVFDASAQELRVLYVHFPADWTQAACDIEDLEYSASTDWNTVLTTYIEKNRIASRTLVDQISSAEFVIEPSSPSSARNVTVRMIFNGSGIDTQLAVASSIRFHRLPAS